MGTIRTLANALASTAAGLIGFRAGCIYEHARRANTIETETETARDGWDDELDAVPFEHESEHITVDGMLRRRPPADPDRHNAIAEHLLAPHPTSAVRTSAPIVHDHTIPFASTATLRMHLTAMHGFTSTHLDSVATCGEPWQQRAHLDALHQREHAGADEDGEPSDTTLESAES